MNPPHLYCTRECGLRDQARRNAIDIKPLWRLDDETPEYARGELLFRHAGNSELLKFSIVASCFADRWEDRANGLQPPSDLGIFQISLPKKYEVRFSNAL